MTFRERVMERFKGGYVGPIAMTYKHRHGKEMNAGQRRTVAKRTAAFRRGRPAVIVTPEQVRTSGPNPWSRG